MKKSFTLMNFLILLVLALLLSAAGCAGSDGRITGAESAEKATAMAATEQPKSLSVGTEQNQTEPTSVESDESLQNDTDIKEQETAASMPETQNEEADSIQNENTEQTGQKTSDSTAAAEEKSVHVHTYTAQVTRAASCMQTGVRTFRCGCGDSYTEIIPAIGHTYEIIPAVSASCTETGLTEGKCCSVCGTVIVPQQQTAALGHTPVPETRTVTVYSVFCHGKVDENHHCCVAWFYSRISTEDAIEQWMVHSAAEHDGDAGYTVAAPSSEEETTGRTICAVCGAVL